MDVEYTRKPKLENPAMIAAWPGMGFLAKISANYLRRRLKAEQFAEIKYFHNALVYSNGVAKLAPIKHRFYASEKYNLIICVGDAQPSVPEESLRLAQRVADIALEMDVAKIYTMAAFPNEYYDDPKVYGVFTDDDMRQEMIDAGVEMIEKEGAVKGLNGVMIGVAKSKGIEGVCLLSDITYANVPQHLASKEVLYKLVELIGIEIDTDQLEIRANKIDASIRRRLDLVKEEEEDPVPEEKKLGYIS